MTTQEVILTTLSVVSEHDDIFVLMKQLTHIITYFNVHTRIVLPCSNTECCWWISTLIIRFSFKCMLCRPTWPFDGNWSKRTQTETNWQPKDRQTNTPTTLYIGELKRRQTETLTNRNFDKPRRRETKTSTHWNLKIPNCQNIDTSTDHHRL